MEHSTEVLYNRTMVYCSPEHRFGSDALLLARFCEPKRAQKAADLCSGCGIVALEWHDRGHRGPCIGLELQPEGSALLSAAVQEQDIGHIEPVCADLRAFRQGEGSFDVCACNPPYFTRFLQMVCHQFLQRRAVRPISRMGLRAKTQPTPLPGTRTLAHWTMCASVRSAF